MRISRKLSVAITASIATVATATFSAFGSTTSPGVSAASITAAQTGANYSPALDNIEWSMDLGYRAQSIYINFHRAVSGCMKANGFKYVVPAMPAQFRPVLPPTAGRTNYGATTAGLGSAASNTNWTNWAALSVSQRSAYAFTLRGVQTSSLTFEPNASDGLVETLRGNSASQTDGCERTARAVVTERATMALRSMAPELDSFKTQLDTDGYIGAEVAWGTCMENAGFSFTNSYEPAQDVMERAARLDQASPTFQTEKSALQTQENATYAADVSCRTTGLDGYMSADAGPRWQAFLQDNQVAAQQAMGFYRSEFSSAVF